MARKWSTKESAVLTVILERVLSENRFWPEPEHHNLINAIVPLAAAEVAVTRKHPVTGEQQILLQYRTFEEWPAPYNKPGWYIPGGYCFWPDDIRQICLTHIRKDLRGEYWGSKIDFDLNTVEIAEPVLIGSKKWMPGDHPFGCPISLIYVCELTAGKIVETDWLKWSDRTIPTDVPWHRSFQDMVFFYLNSTPEQKAWLAAMQAKVDAIT